MKCNHLAIIIVRACGRNWLGVTMPREGNATLLETFNTALNARPLSSSTASRLLSPVQCCCFGLIDNVNLALEQIGVRRLDPQVVTLHCFDYPEAVMLVKGQRVLI